MNNFLEHGDANLTLIRGHNNQTNSIAKSTISYKKRQSPVLYTKYTTERKDIKTDSQNGKWPKTSLWSEEEKSLGLNVKKQRYFVFLF
jgi:hypothetical protein